MRAVFSYFFIAAQGVTLSAVNCNVDFPSLDRPCISLPRKKLYGNANVIKLH